LFASIGFIAKRLFAEAIEEISLNSKSSHSRRAAGFTSIIFILGYAQGVCSF